MESKYIVYFSMIGIIQSMYLLSACIDRIITTTDN